MHIRTILDQIDLGSIALPEFQRGYVWNRDQVRGLMHSLYRKHPVGSLLVWLTKTENASARGDGVLAPGSVKLLLDGQQRITSLYGLVRGAPPKFFDGNADAFTGLYFNLDDESFEFYAPLKMKDNPLWVSVTDIMKVGAGEAIQQLVTVPEFQSNLSAYINRLNAVDSIKDIDLHIEEVTGEDKTVDVVVDIFNRVNSGGTKLSKGDLALAKICAEWPEGRGEMKKRLDKWRKADFHFRLEWLLRCINTTITGESYFSALKDVDTETFKGGLHTAERMIDTLLNLVSARLGLDHDRVLGSRYSFPLLVRYLSERNGKFVDYRERDRILYWYVHSFLWGRYAGSTETVLSQDLAAIRDPEGALDRLIEQLRQNRGDLRVRGSDFVGWSQGARFYPMLYMLTRVWRAKDWQTGVELSAHLLGTLNRLQIHHIFPKALLYKHGYSRPEVNAIANFTFLTQDTNLLVSDRDPLEYLEELASKQPGAVESHWIPMDRELWRVERYRDFLAARRALLAKAANGFLDGLIAGTVLESPAMGERILERELPTPLGIVASEDEERILSTCNEWVVAHGLPEGDLSYELVDNATGQPLVVVDLAWPEGLQQGYSQPAALLVDEGKEVEEILLQHGYRCFTNVEAFQGYVQHEILAMDEPAGPSS
jgi:hypothetical protein